MNKEVHDRVLCALKKRIEQDGHDQLTRLLAPSTRLASLPLDPIALSATVCELENCFGTSLAAAQIDRMSTVADLIAAIDRRAMPIRFVLA